MKKFAIKWYYELFLKLWPKMAMKFLVAKMGINDSPFNKLDDVFAKTGRIDIFPYTSGARGFMIVIDKRTAIYFNQDGDHFVYDGFEIGEYNKGDVTIFDGLKTETPYTEEGQLDA